MGVHNQSRLNGKYLISPLVSNWFYYVKSAFDSKVRPRASRLIIAWMHFRELLSHGRRIQLMIIFATPKVCVRQQQVKCYLEVVD